MIFHTIAVEMPFFNPRTLTADEVYNLTAFVLFKNGLIKKDEVMDRETLPKVQMPNRNNFPASDEIYMDMQKRLSVRFSVERVEKKEEGVSGKEPPG